MVWRDGHDEHGKGHPHGRRLAVLGSHGASFGSELVGIQGSQSGTISG